MSFIKPYTTDELSNLQLGQGGSDMLVNTNNASFGSGLRGNYAEVVDKGDHPAGVEAVYTHTGAQLAGAINSSTEDLTIDDGDLVLTGLAVNDIIIVHDGTHDREIMKVTAIDASASPDELTVTRDYLGLGATSHGANADIFYYKEVPLLSHWIAIKNMSDNGSGDTLMGSVQAVMQTRPEFNDTALFGLPYALIHPGVSASAGNGLDMTVGNRFFNMATEEIIYGRFTKVAVEAPSGSDDTGALKLIRGYK